MSKDPIKLMVTIVHRGKGDVIVRNFGDHVGLHYIALGQGTASSEVLEYLGVGETEKDVVFSLLPESHASGFLREVRDGMSLHLPDRGIAFLLPLTAASRVVERTVQNTASEAETAKEDTPMETQKNYTMIMAVVNRGYTDDVMEAAKAQGARGGTVLHARGLGSEEAGKFLGIALQPEREIVMLVVPQKDKVPIMNAIGKAAGMHSKARGFLLALPVDDFAGIA